MKRSAQLRVWTTEDRQKQSISLSQRKIWLKSTGPRTPEGKCRSSMNACKDGYEERLELKRINRYLRLQKLFLTTYRYAIKHGNALPPHRLFILNAYISFLENELSDLDTEIRTGGTSNGNILSFPLSPHTKSPPRHI